jgi:hypothetical protein
MKQKEHARLVGSAIRQSLPCLLFVQPFHSGLKLFVNIMLFKGVPFFFPQTRREA